MLALAPATSVPFHIRPSQGGVHADLIIIERLTASSPAAAAATATTAAASPSTSAAAAATATATATSSA